MSNSNLPPFNRPPMQQGCYPQPTVTMPDPNNPCAMLAFYTLAAAQVSAGGQPLQVRDGERWITYQKSDLKFIEAQINKYQQLCNNGGMGGRGRAVRMGGIHKHPMGRYSPYF